MVGHDAPRALEGWQPVRDAHEGLVKAIMQGRGLEEENARAWAFDRELVGHLITTLADTKRQLRQLEAQLQDLIERHGESSEA